MSAAVVETTRRTPIVSMPRALSRAGRSALAWAVLLADDEGTLKHRDLVEALDADSATVGRRVQELEGFGLVRRLRKPPPFGSHIRVSWKALYGKTWKACTVCPRPVKNVRGARFCAVCQASIARKDRSWKRMAFEIWVSAKKGTSEAATVYKIRAATGHPLFTPSDPGAHEGIVPWMLSEKMLLDPMWRERIKAAGGGEPDDVV